MSHDIKSAERPAPDCILTAIADYALRFEINSALAYETAAYCLMDTLACGFQALKYPACTKLMGPVVPGATLDQRRACSRYCLRTRSDQRRLQHRRHDSLARFQRHLAGGGMGTPVRQSRRNPRGGRLPVARPASRIAVRDVLTAMIKAHEIQGDSGARRTASIESDWIMCSWFVSPPRPWPPRCSAVRAIRSSMPYRTPGSTAARCAPTGTRRIPVRARAGPPAMRPAAPCVTRCSRSRTRWDIPRRCRPRPGASRTCCSRENRCRCRSRSAAT